MARDTERVVVGYLLTGHRLGYHTMPQTILDALAFRRRIAEVERELAASLGETAPERVAQRVARTIEDDIKAERPTSAEIFDDILAAEREAQKATALRAVFKELLEYANADVEVAYLDVMDSVLVEEHLRPAQEEVFDELRSIAPVLDGMAFPLSAPQALELSAKQRSAYQALEKAAARYQHLRETHRMVTGLDGNEPAVEIRNWKSLFYVGKTDMWIGHRQTGFRPDPEPGLNRLLWLATSEAEPWMPTVDEYGELMAQLKESVRPAATGDYGIFLPAS